MNEHSQRFVILNRVRSNPNEAAEKIARESLPVCTDPAELLEFANARTDQSFRTPSEVLNEMLRTKFLGLGVTEFMEIYTKLHVGQAFAFPTPPTVTCTFKEMDTAKSVQNFLSGHQRTIGEDRFGTFLNLHTDDVYEFTIIHANFNLEEEHKSIYHGYYYGENEHFAFFIKSSAQFDLTVVYSEK